MDIREDAPWLLEYTKDRLPRREVCTSRQHLYRVMAELTRAGVATKRRMYPILPITPLVPEAYASARPPLVLSIHAATCMRADPVRVGVVVASGHGRAHAHADVDPAAAFYGIPNVSRRALRGYALAWALGVLTDALRPGDVVRVTHSTAEGLLRPNDDPAWYTLAERFANERLWLPALHAVVRVGVRVENVPLEPALQRAAYNLARTGKGRESTLEQLAESINF